MPRCRPRKFGAHPHSEIRVDVVDPPRQRSRWPLGLGTRHSFATALVPAILLLHPVLARADTPPPSQECAYVISQAGDAGLLSIINTEHAVITASLPLPATVAAVIVSPDGRTGFTYTGPVSRPTNGLQLDIGAKALAIGGFAAGGRRAAVFPFAPNGYRSGFYAYVDAGVFIYGQDPVSCGGDDCGFESTGFRNTCGGSAVTRSGNGTVVINASSAVPNRPAAVCLINPSNAATITSVPFREYAGSDSTVMAVAANESGSLAYIAAADGEIAVVDTAAHQVLDRFELPRVEGEAARFGIRDMLITRDDRYLVVTRPPAGLVALVDLATHAQVATVAVGVQPEWLASSPSRDRAFVINRGSNTLAVLDLDHFTLVDTVALDGSPRDLTVALTVNGCPLPQPLGAACEARVDCTTRFCTDEVCCESACDLDGQICSVPGFEGQCLEAQPTATPSPTPTSSPVPKTNGTSCIGGGECASSFCVESICCDRRCESENDFCALAGSVGTCVSITLPTRPPTTQPTAFPTSTAPSTTITSTPTTDRTSTPQVNPSTSPSPFTTCAGDCDGDRVVTIGELIDGVRMSLGMLGVEHCAALDRDGNAEVTIDELIAAVQAALTGCR